jgi:hypothetical protein
MLAALTDLLPHGVALTPTVYLVGYPDSRTDAVVRLPEATNTHNYLELISV